MAFAIVLLFFTVFAAGYIIGGMGKHSHKPGVSHFRFMTKEEEKNDQF